MKGTLGQHGHGAGPIITIAGVLWLVSTGPWGIFYAVLFVALTAGICLLPWQSDREQEVIAHRQCGRPPVHVLTALAALPVAIAIGAWPVVSFTLFAGIALVGSLTPWPLDREQVASSLIGDEAQR